jgi:hypothetical protein
VIELCISENVRRELESKVWEQGYFAERIARGDRPDYRLPQASLPEVSAGARMEIATCFMAARAGN